MEKKYSILFVALGAAIVLGVQYFWRQSAEQTNRLDSTIILEKIEAVSKLVTAEGQYANVYHVEDYFWADIWPFRKQATIRVKLKALVGVDLKKMKITPDPVTQTFYFDSIPDIEPIAIDPQIEYYDISEGIFNTFGKDDLNKIQRSVREMAHQAIKQGGLAAGIGADSLLQAAYAEDINVFFVPLLEKARQEAGNQLAFIEEMVGLAGWKVAYGPHNSLVPPKPVTETNLFLKS